MANYNLSNQDIKDTFQQLAQVSGSIEGGITGSAVTDGTGSRVTNLHVTASNALSSSEATSAISASHAVQADSALTATSSSHAVASDTSISSSHAIQSDNATSASFASTALSASYAPNTGVTSIIAGTNITIDQSTGDVTINSSGGGGSADTGSLLVTASNVDATITYTKGDGSTFQNIINNVASATEAEDLVITVKNTSGGTLAKGTAVHAVSVTGENVDVIAASNDSASAMPAIGILSEQLTNNSAGSCIIGGRLIGVDTSGLTAGASVYVNLNGGFTATKPTGSSLIQNIGTAAKIDGTDGEIIVQGSGRTNDLPNIQQGYAWVGDANGVPQAVATSSIAGVQFPFTGSAEISGSLNVDGDTSVTGSLDVDGNITQQGSITTTGGVSTGTQTSPVQFPSSLLYLDTEGFGNGYSGYQIINQRSGSTALSGQLEMSTFSGLDGSNPIFGNKFDNNYLWWTSQNFPQFNVRPKLVAETGATITGSLDVSGSVRALGGQIQLGDTGSGNSLDMPENGTALFKGSTDFTNGAFYFGDQLNFGSSLNSSGGGSSVNFTDGTNIQISADMNLSASKQLIGTASYAMFALSASYAPGGGGAAFPFNGDAVITGSLVVSQSGLSSGDDVFVLGFPRTGGSSLQGVIRSTVDDGLHLYGNKNFNNGASTFSGGILGIESGPVNIGAAGSPVSLNMQNGSAITASNGTLPISGNVDIDGVLSLPGIANVSASIAAGGGGGSAFPFTGSANITGSLNLDGPAEIIGNTDINGILSLPNIPNVKTALDNAVSFPFTGSANVSGSVNVDGDITTNERLMVGSTDPRVGSGNGIYTDRAARFDSTLSVLNGGTVTIDTDGQAANIPLRVNNGNDFNVNTFTVHEKSDAFDVTIAGVTKITGSLQVTGSTDINGVLSLPGITNVSASIVSAAGGSTFPFTGSAGITGSLDVVGNTDIDGTLSLPGITDVSASIASAGGGGSPGLVAGSGTNSMASDSSLTSTAAVASGLESISLGDGATASGEYAVAYGKISEATNAQTTGLGYRARATGYASTAIGAQARAINNFTVAVGDGSEATGNNTIAIGKLASSHFSVSTACIAIGKSAFVRGANGISIGEEASVGTGATNGIAIGNSSDATVSGAVAIGEGVQATTVDTATVKLLQIANYASINFADDSAAATGGIPLGGVYHTSGALKIRIT